MTDKHETQTIELEQWREEYRQAHIGPGYRGLLHLAFTTSLSLLIIGLCIHHLAPVHGWEWGTVPLTLVYANFAEWAGHKFVMHRPVRGLNLVYRRHALQHHRFFSQNHMEIGSTRDFKAVLFPPVLVSFFLVAFFLPIALMLDWALGRNVALLFTASGLGYFLNYELLHLSYHLRANHWVHRIPGFSALARLHTTHHDPREMAHHNFNITYPLMDYVMRTWKRR